MLNYRVRAAGKKAAEIYIYDFIGSNRWGEGISAKRFADDLKALGQVDLLTIRINSPGGIAFEGISIFNVLERHPARIEIEIDALAASIASVIAMAGDEIRIAANAMMMIHNPYSFAFGDAEELRHQADMMDQMKVGLVNTYAARTQTDPLKISDMMNEETWMTAQEAVDSGFADVVTGELAIAASFDPSRFKNVPMQLRQQAQRPATPMMDQYTARIAAQERRVIELRKRPATA